MDIKISVNPEPNGAASPSRSGFFYVRTMASEKLNGYTLTKAWFNYTFEHPEKFNPTDGYLYLFLIEVANRSGWSEKFDVSAKDIMQALGIGTYNTYRKSFDKLVADGWITVIKKSTNQFQKTIIALSKNNTATNGALDRALYQACNEACDLANAPIIKTVNNKPKTVNNKPKTVKATPPPSLIDVEPEILERYLKFETWAKENAPRILKMKEPLTPKQLQSLLEVSDAVSVKTIFEEMHNWADLTKKVSAYKTAKTWLQRRKTNPIGRQPEPQQKSTYDRKFKGYE